MLETVNKALLRWAIGRGLGAESSRKEPTAGEDHPRKKKQPVPRDGDQNFHYRLGANSSLRTPPIYPLPPTLSLRGILPGFLRDFLPAAPLWSTLNTAARLMGLHEQDRSHSTATALSLLGSDYTLWVDCL